jgi:NADH dehydrogenase
VEILDEILRVTGRKRLKVHIPMPLARLQAALLEFIFPKLLRVAPPISRDQLLMLQEDNTGDPKTADELFSLKPGTFAEGIAKYLVRG